jgi:two-component system sensor histidine kinase YesM
MGRVMKQVAQWMFSSLRVKMLAMFVVLTMVPLIAVGIVSYQKSFRTISDHSKAAFLLAADRLARDIDVLFQDTMRLLELENHQAVLRYLFSQTDSYADAKDILQAFDLYRKTYRNDNVLNIAMVNLYGRGISERKGVFALNQNPLRNPHFQHLMNAPDEVLIVPPDEALPQDRLDGFQYESEHVVSIMTTIKQRITHEVIGFIVIDLDADAVLDYIRDAMAGQAGYFYVADASGKPLFAPDADRSLAEALPLASGDAPRWNEPSGSFVEDGTGEPVFVAYTTSADTGWKMIGMAPLREIVKDAHEIERLIFLSVGLSIVFTIGLYVYVTSRLTRPIQILKHKMRKAASGFLDVKVHPAGTDELADLGNSFNIMIEQIKMLMQRNIREREQVQKAELRTLQAQINPHFLYNSLDSIVWMAEAGKNREVIRLVQALSRFFRISLSKGRDFISVGEEVEHVRNYLVIQQMRYSDILEYDIDVPTELRSIPILKMTLQPIVENALYHGIKNKRGKGRIRIAGTAHRDGTLRLSVTDNGIGMGEEKLGELRRLLDDPPFPGGEGEPDGGYGLLNVQRRLRLYYGSRFGVTIDSREGLGTQVEVAIPIPIPIQGGNRLEESVSGG